jgi:hypothetical protein
MRFLSASAGCACAPRARRGTERPPEGEAAAPCVSRNDRAACDSRCIVMFDLNNSVSKNAIANLMLDRTLTSRFMAFNTMLIE